MKLGARLVATSLLGLGIAVVLAAATLISRRFIEAPAYRSQPPVLRPAAVFAPTLLREVAGAREIDAVSGSAKAAAPAPTTLGHAPQPVPEELLLALAPPGPETDAPASSAAASATPAPPPAARPTLHRPPPAPPEPQLELIDDNLWRP